MWRYPGAGTPNSFRLSSTTMALAYRPHTGRTFSGRSTGSTRRATKTKAGRASASPSPETSPARTAATSNSRTAPSAALGRRFAFPFDDETAAPRSDRGADPPGELALRAGARLGRDLLAPLEDHQCRDGTDAEFAGDPGILIDIELGDLHFALHFGGDFLKRRGDHPAGAAPL